VERALICPPGGHVGAISPEARRSIIEQSDINGFYEKVLDRESAYEKLKARADQTTAGATDRDVSSPRTGRGRRVPATPADTAEALAMSMARAASSQLGRQLVRGVLGSLFGGRRR